MTKKLEDLFNLADKESAEDQPVKNHEEVKSLDRSYKEVEQITKSLPTITELDSLDEKELDDLAKKAEQAYDDLMDLGMNVEARYSGRIFEVAGTMLKNAIDAKAAKIDKKLKMVELQLKKLAIDKKHNSDEDKPIEAQGFIISDRNTLLEKLKNMNK